MLLTLTIYANLKQLSPNYRKAATDLGASPLQAFIHVILPLTFPGTTGVKTAITGGIIAKPQTELGLK